MYIVASVIALVIWWYISHAEWKKGRVYQCMENLPGIPFIPWLGTTYALIGVARKDLFETIRYYNKMYGPMFRSWNGYTPEVHLMKAEYLEVVLNNSVQINKGTQYGKLMPWLGEGLLTSSGSKWHQHRKLLTPAFHFQILENFQHIFTEKSKILVDMLDNKANGDVFDIYPYITHCALDIICETTMGVQVNAMSDSDNEYIQSVYGVCELIVKKMIRPWLNIDKLNLFSDNRNYNRCINTLHNFSKKVIKDRKLAKSNSINISNMINDEDANIGRKRRLSFLDLLLEASEGGRVLTDSDIRQEVDTFMFEGHDTTTAAMCWSLFLLGNHQEIQEKAYQEIKQVIQANETPQTLAELGELKYLEAVIKEALRLYPSVTVITRKLSEEISIDGKTIPAGVDVNLHIFEVHRDPHHFPDPLRFDPDRFLPHNSKNRHPYAFVPFSAGPRNCIGQKFAMYEEKTVLASILKKFKIIAVDTEETIKMTSELILRPQQGIRVILEKRK